MCAIMGFSTKKLDKHEIWEYFDRTLSRGHVITTTTKVTVVIPCIFSEIPTAMAVVTDLGKREIARK